MLANVGSSGPVIRFVPTALDRPFARAISRHCHRSTPVILSRIHRLATQGVPRSNSSIQAHGISAVFPRAVSVAAERRPHSSVNTTLGETWHEQGGLRRSRATAPLKPQGRERDRLHARDRLRRSRATAPLKRFL